MTLFHLGLAVWGFDRWAGSFMPSAVRKADMLRRYAERMDCVEGNDSFYGVPSSTTLERRARETPRHFRFCPKLPRSISHEGRLAPQAAAAVDFAAHMHAGLGERLGPFGLEQLALAGIDAVKRKDVARIKEYLKQAGRAENGQDAAVIATGETPFMRVCEVGDTDLFHIFLSSTGAVFSVSTVAILRDNYLRKNGGMICQSKYALKIHQIYSVNIDVFL